MKKAAAASKVATKKPVPNKSVPARKAAPSKATKAKAPVKQVSGKAPAAKKAAVVKAPAKSAANKSVAKAPAKVAKTPAAGKAAATRKPASPASVPAQAPKSAPAKKSPTKAAKAPAASKPTPPPAPAPARRPVGKVAVAVAAKPQPPAPRGKVKVVPYKTEKDGRVIVPDGYRPSADEEYMSPLQLEYFRQRLMKWRADLVEESKQTIENLKEEVRDVGDEAERATRETENSLELRTRDRYRKLISKIDSTLKRVDSGDYGFCVDTGEEIGLDRLEARLTAERTIDAQERWEHLQKQMGD